jgi:hypothetical protein
MMTEPTQVWPPEPGGAGRDQTTRAGLLGGDGAIHGERAMAALRRALAAGFATPKWIWQDPDLVSLRSRVDFRALIMDVVFPADPFARPGSAP